MSGSLTPRPFTRRSSVWRVPSSVSRSSVWPATGRACRTTWSPPCRSRPRRTGCAARKPAMSKSEPGSEIQLETMASTTMNARVSQVRFRNRRSPRHQGAFVPSNARRHNPARTRDGAQYRNGAESGSNDCHGVARRMGRLPDADATRRAPDTSRRPADRGAAWAKHSVIAHDQRRLIASPLLTNAGEGIRIGRDTFG